MSNQNHERERVVIEAGILAVTLLFIVAGIRGITEDVAAMVCLSSVGAYFIVAAILATFQMFLGQPGFLPRIVGSEFAFFVAGLAGLVAILFGIGLSEAGAISLRDSMLTATVVMVVALLAAYYAYRRWFRYFHRH